MRGRGIYTFMHTTKKGIWINFYTSSCLAMIFWLETQGGLCVRSVASEPLESSRVDRGGQPPSGRHRCTPGPHLIKINCSLPKRHNIILLDIPLRWREWSFGITMRDISMVCWTIRDISMGCRTSTYLSHWYQSNGGIFGTSTDRSRHWIQLVLFFYCLSFDTSLFIIWIVYNFKLFTNFRGIKIHRLLSDKNCS